MGRALSTATVGAGERAVDSRAGTDSGICPDLSASGADGSRWPLLSLAKSKLTQGALLADLVEQLSLTRDERDLLALLSVHQQVPGPRHDSAPDRSGSGWAARHGVAVNSAE